jgi:hypothetical protein
MIEPFLAKPFSIAYPVNKQAHSGNKQSHLVTFLSMFQIDEHKWKFMPTSTTKQSCLIKGFVTI